MCVCKREYLYKWLSEDASARKSVCYLLCFTQYYQDCWVSCTPREPICESSSFPAIVLSSFLRLPLNHLKCCFLRRTEVSVARYHSLSPTLLLCSSCEWEHFIKNRTSRTKRFASLLYYSIFIVYLSHTSSSTCRSLLFSPVPTWSHTAVCTGPEAAHHTAWEWSG